MKRPCCPWQRGTGAHRRATAGREGVDRPRGGRRLPRLAPQPEHRPEPRSRRRQDRRADRGGPPAEVGRERRDRRGPGTAVGHLCGQHLERPPGGGAVLAGLVRGVRLRQSVRPAWTKRLAVPDSETPARSKTAADRLIARRGIHLREKTLWRMLYETCARVEEILGVNVEDLDLAARRCPVKAKGARSKARRRGQAREDFALETVYWDAGTARPREDRQLARRVPGHRPGPPLLRPGPRPPRWTHRRPRYAGCLTADADGQVPPQEAGERPPVLQTDPRDDIGADQPARPRRRAAPSRLSGRKPGSEAALSTEAAVWSRGNAS